MNSYSKWDKWANTIDEDGEEMDQKIDKPTCVFGKPMTEEEFKNRNDKESDVKIINADTK